MNNFQLNSNRMTAELLKANELHKVDPVFGQVSFDGHEQVVFCHDKDTGLKKKKSFRILYCKFTYRRL